MTLDEKALPETSDTWPSLAELHAKIGRWLTREEAREAVEVLKRRGILVEVDGRIYLAHHDPRRAAKEGEGA
jgi:crotonobetainyl-CoA:carnitine CoA-transferase CaiB-like acyl-CoA transferase